MKTKQITYIKPNSKLKGFESYNDQKKKAAGKRIADLIKSKGLTLDTIVKDTGLAKRTIIAIKRGEGAYTIDSVNKLTYYLNYGTINTI